MDEEYREKFQQIQSTIVLYTFKKICEFNVIKRLKLTKLVC